MTKPSGPPILLGRVWLSLLAAAVLGGRMLLSPTVALAQGGPCVDGTATSRHAWVEKDPAGGNTSWVTAAKGYIYIPSSSHFFPCNPTGVGNDGPTAWVSIVPGSGSGNYNNTNAILQIGVVRCNNPAYTACYNSVPHFWWARGGCGIYLPVPMDLGETTWSATHLYEISLLGTVYSLKIDGVTKASIDRSSNPINCWAQDDKAAVWSAERWDKGDSSGSNGATNQRNQFTTLRYATPANNVWLSPSITACGITPGAGSGPGRYVCSFGSDSLHVWTLNP
jgi:hypothetical protein